MFSGHRCNKQCSQVNEKFEPVSDTAQVFQVGNLQLDYNSFQALVKSVPEMFMADNTSCFVVQFSLVLSCMNCVASSHHSILRIFLYCAFFCMRSVVCSALYHSMSVYGPS